MAMIMLAGMGGASGVHLSPSGACVDVNCRATKCDGSEIPSREGIAAAGGDFGDVGNFSETTGHRRPQAEYDALHPGTVNACATVDKPVDKPADDDMGLTKGMDNKTLMLVAAAVVVLVMMNKN